MNYEKEIKDIRKRIKILGEQSIPIENLSYYAEAKFKLIQDAPKILARNYRLEKLHLELISTLRLCLEENGSGQFSYQTLPEWEIKALKIIKEHEGEVNG